MKRREALNLVLHLGVGGVLAGLVLYHHWFLLLATFVYAALREQAQHRLILLPVRKGSKNYRIEKRTFFDFGWVTWHRIWEVFQFVIGCLVALCVYEWIKWEWLT